MKKILFLLAIAALFISCDQTKPSARFTYEVYEDQVVFYNQSKNADYYEWDFGDGYTSSEFEPIHEYEYSGTYTVTLRAYESFGNTFDVCSEKVTISIDGDTPSDPTTPPVANFSFSGANQYAPATVSFTNTSANGASYYWEFGDGDYSYAKNPSHTYTSSGAYSVTLQVTNNAGSDVISKTVNIKNDPTKWNLTKFTLTTYPETDNGDNWDYTDAGPDIYFKILEGTTVIYTSSTKDNVSSSSLPLIWNVSGVSLDVNTQYTIKYYDEDGVLDSDDLMGSMNFKPNLMDFNSNSWSWTAGSWGGTWNYTWN